MIKTYKPMSIPTFKEGQKLKIDINAKSVSKRKKDEVFKGVVVAVNSKHITVKNKNGIRESFNYSDFVTGDLRLI